MKHRWVARTRRRSAACELESPLLARYNEHNEPLLDGEGHTSSEAHGAVYLASQDQNPFGSLIAIYLVVEDEQTGCV